MSEMLPIREALLAMSRPSPWREVGSIDFVPSPKGREALERAVAKQRALGRVTYSLSDAARDVLDWAVSQAEAMRRTR